MNEELTYEHALQEVEQIVAAVERGDLPISQLSSSIKRAQQYLAFCKEQLTQVENEVNTLLNDHGQE